MAKHEIKEKLQVLQKQLDQIILEIQQERTEAKDDEINVLDELMMNKAILEQEIEKLQTAIYDTKKYPEKKFVLKQNGVIRKLGFTNNSLVDSSVGLISEECPLGQALKKARVGDKFKVTTPIGETEYLLLDIE